MHEDERGSVRTCRSLFGDRTYVELVARSRIDVVRGLHYQVGQSKVVRCLEGAINDYVVDLRVGSPQFGCWERIVLTAIDDLALFIPPGVAHGYEVRNDSLVHYQLSAALDPKLQGAVQWNDPDINIPWSIEYPILSDRDRGAPSFAEYKKGPITFNYKKAYHDGG